MARPQVEEVHEDDESLSSGAQDELVEDGSEGAIEVEDEEEFHTSSDSDGDDDEDGDDLDLAPTAPLLPAEILKRLPSPVQSLEEIPWEHLTRKQKVARRNQSRQAKKLTWDQLRKSTNGTAVLEAGRVAQLKRGFVSLKEKVRSGRVDKRSKAKMSGRQQLVEHRKRLAGQKSGVIIRPSVKEAKTVKDKR